MADQIALALTLGIVSGLLTTFLIWLLTVIWRSKIVPWYEARVYQGIHIQGAWSLEHDKDAEDPWAHSESLTLVQTAHRISGAATLSSLEDPERPPSSLTVDGGISDRIVSLSLNSPLKDRLSYSVLLLEVVGDGTILSGEVSFYNVESSQIESSSVKYKKIA